MFKDANLRFGTAWMALSLSLAVHVADEALTGFLEFYNPIAMAIRERLPFLTLPTFTFKVWLGGLLIAICLLLALSVFGFRGARWMLPLAYAIGAIMVFNGLLHISASVYLGRPTSGVYSSPLLLLASIYLLATARHPHPTLPQASKRDLPA